MTIRRLLCAAAMFAVACRAETPRRSFQLATTTITVHPFAVGSGKALQMAAAGAVKLTITHDPEAEGLCAGRQTVAIQTGNVGWQAGAGNLQPDVACSRTLAGSAYPESAFSRPYWRLSHFCWLSILEALTVLMASSFG